MRVSLVVYPENPDSSYPNRKLIRQFHRWDAWTAKQNGVLLILLDEYVRRYMTVCEYDNEEERSADIQVLQTIQDSFAPPGAGGGGTPQPAFVAVSPAQPGTGKCRST